MVTIDMLIDILEQNDMKYTSTGNFSGEIEFYSPLGEDVVLDLDYTSNSIVESFISLYESFDAEEHAAMWINSRGTNGVPDSIRDLLEDAEWIESKLGYVARELKNAK